MDNPQSLWIRFSDGTVLAVSSPKADLSVKVTHSPAQKDPSRPTARQMDYLRFISRYMSIFGRSPAESDIQRHFLVSGPSVHMMLQTLERRGFIQRQPRKARSIRLLFDPNMQALPGSPQPVTGSRSPSALPRWARGGAPGYR